MRLAFVELLDEPGYERRLYDCLSCKQSLAPRRHQARVAGQLHAALD